jgi:hypothetical protein
MGRDLRIDFLLCWVWSLENISVQERKFAHLIALTIPRSPFSDWIHTFVSGDKYEGANVGIPASVSTCHRELTSICETHQLQG